MGDDRHGHPKAFDFAGKELWTRDIQKEYGRFGLQRGYGSSPMLDGDSLFVQVLHGMKTDAPSDVLRISKSNGRTIWRQESQQARAWNRPILHNAGVVRNGKISSSSSRAATQ